MERKHGPSFKDFDLELHYIDEKKVRKKTVKINEVKEYLFSFWKLTAQLDQVNIEHCESCEFGKLCH